MALTRQMMIERMLASDAHYNGRFITAVLTTGIYCLPSCHAKKPKPENVRFFKNSHQAKKAGFRPCKLCQPDDFEGGMNRELMALEQCAMMARANPKEFPTVDALADAAASAFPL